jgi:hypothetical protein
LPSRIEKLADAQKIQEDRKTSIARKQQDILQLLRIYKGFE